MKVLSGHVFVLVFPLERFTQNIYFGLRKKYASSHNSFSLDGFLRPCVFSVAVGIMSANADNNQMSANADKKQSLRSATF